MIFNEIKTIKGLSIGLIAVSAIVITLTMFYRVLDSDQLELERDQKTQDQQIEQLEVELLAQYNAREEDQLTQYKKNVYSQELDLDNFLTELELKEDRSKIITALKERSARIRDLQLKVHSERSKRNIETSVLGFLLIFASLLLIIIMLVIKKRNEDKKEWLDTTAHQLRKSVSPMRASINNLLTLDLSKPERAKTLKIVASDAKKLEDLTEKMLDLYKLGEIKNIHKSSVNVGLIVQRVICDFELLNKKNLVLSYSTKINEPLISGDATYIEQLIKNLIDNAMGFSYPEGRVSVEISNEKKFIVVKVIDQGVGIKDKSEILIDGAVYPSARTGEHSTGHGLGLKLVRRVIKLHSGKFDINNNKDGKGATVTVKFPL